MKEACMKIYPLNPIATRIQFGNASAVSECLAISRAADAEGFNWPSSDHFTHAVSRELREFMDEAAQVPPSPKRMAEELGDILLSAVKLADHYRIDPEAALREASQRFQQRFEVMKTLCPKPIASLSLQEKIDYFKAAKRQLEARK